jgi:hypothetical protein
MLAQVLSSIFERDLAKVKLEIEQYRDENKIWIIDKGILNSAGNLCLHLIGNLNTYIGKELGGTNYVRNRDLEFSQKNVPRPELVKLVESTIIVVKNSLEKLTKDDLEKIYPVKVFENAMTTEYFLVHLSAHLAYHLGQINYHRRLLDLD